jgi:hypothetical protein
MRIRVVGIGRERHVDGRGRSRRLSKIRERKRAEIRTGLVLRLLGETALGDVERFLPPPLPAVDLRQERMFVWARLRRSSRAVRQTEGGGHGRSRPQDRWRAPAAQPARRAPVPVCREGECRVEFRRHHPTIRRARK